MRGFTLVELLVSVTITMVAIAAACLVLIEGQRFTRNNEEVSQSNDNSRLASEKIVGALQVAGMGAAKGVWRYDTVLNAARLVNPIFGIDGSTNSPVTPDDIWMILPDRRSFNTETCHDTASGTPFTGVGVPFSTDTVAGNSPVIGVPCTETLFPINGTDNPTYLMVSNFLKPAVLLTHPTAATSSTGNNIGVIQADESAFPAFPPTKFQQGDLIFSVTVVRFFVDVDTMFPGRRALYQQTGILASGTPKPAFIANSVQTTLVQHDIEDLQVAYATDPNQTGVPDNYVYSNGFSDSFVNPLRALRVTVVGIHHRKINLGSVDNGLATYPSLTIENQALPTSVYRRSVLSRRVDLVNLAPANL